MARHGFARGTTLRTLGLLVVSSAVTWVAAEIQDLWLLGITAFSGGIWDVGESARIAGEQMLALINDAQEILPGYRLRILWQDDGCSRSGGLNTLLKDMISKTYDTFPLPPHLDANGDGAISTKEAGVVTLNGVAGPGPVGLLCCSCSSTTRGAIDAAKMFNMPMISSSSQEASLSDHTAYPHFFRTILPQPTKIPVMLSIVRLIGLTRFTMLTDPLVYAGSVRTLVKEAVPAGLTLVGRDWGSEVPGLRGAIISEEMWGRAQLAARDLVASGARVVIVNAFTNLLQLVMCATSRHSVRGFVWFPAYIDTTLWTNARVGAKAPPGACTTETITGMAQGLFKVVVMEWWEDPNLKLTCAPGTSVGEFQAEYFRRHHAPWAASDSGAVTSNHTPISLGGIQADSICMMALMLRELLVRRNRTVSELASFGQPIFEEALEVLGRSHFHGVQGELRFEPGLAESATSVLRVMQLRASNSPCRGPPSCGNAGGVTLADIALGRGDNMTFLPNSRLEFHFPDEVYAMPDRFEAGFVKLPDFRVCLNGKVYNSELRECVDCPHGRVYVSSVAECTCTTGFSVANDTANDTCIPCAVGRFSTLLGAAACKSCPIGTYSRFEGASMCDLCPVGSYAASSGSSRCDPCGQNRASPELWTTMRLATGASGRTWIHSEGSESTHACGCDRNARMDVSGECVLCTEGLDCRGMTDVNLLEGYFSEEHVSVYRCRGERERCKGGKPGETCQEGRDGLLCAECLPGRTPASGGQCEPCSGGSTWALLVAAVVGVLVCTCGSYYLLLNAMDPTPLSPKLLGLVVGFGQCLTAVQMLRVTTALPCEWHYPLDKVLGVFSKFNLKVDFLRLGCTAYVPPVARFSLSVTAIVLPLVVSLFVHGANTLIWHHGAFWSRLHVLINTVGLWLLAVYITIVETVLTPLQCELHPNGRHTVRQYPSIHCHEQGEFVSMVCIGALAFLTVPVPFMARIIFVVRQFPSRVRRADVSFLRLNSFMFFRFRADAYWYILVQVARSLFVALVPILRGAFQILGLQLVVIASAGSAVLIRPWTAVVANALEAAVPSCLVFICSTAAISADATTSERSTLSYACLVLIGACGLALLGLLSGSLLMSLSRSGKRFQFFLCHHKAGAGAFARLLKLALLESPGVRRDVFLDADNLESLRSLFTVVGYETETVVLLASRELFRRPWCIGEITIARLRGVPTVLVTLPCACLPDDNAEDWCSGIQDGLQCLAMEGLGLQDVQTSLRWVSSLKRLEVSVDEAAVCKLTAELTGVASAPTDLCGDDVERFAFILCDLRDPEVIAMALVLQKLILPHALKLGTRPPMLLQPGDPFPKDLSDLLLLLSCDFLSNEACLRSLIGAAYVNARMLPVILQEEFQWPYADKVQELGRCQGMDVAFAVNEALQEVSVRFCAQHADEATLQLAASQIARRLFHTITKKPTGQSDTSTERAREVFQSSGHRNMDI